MASGCRCGAARRSGLSVRLSRAAGVQGRRCDRLCGVSADLHRRHHPCGDLAPPGSPAASCRSNMPISPPSIAPLTRVAEIRALRRTAANLLDTYVGRQAGERILAGNSVRGHVEAIQAVLWLSDMRGFTARSRSAAAAGADRPAQPLFRLPGAGHSRLWRRGAEVYRRRAARDLSARGGSDAAEVCRRALFARARRRRRLRRARRAGRRSTMRALRPGAAYRRGDVRQYRRRQPARLHLHRAGGVSCGAAGEAARRVSAAPWWLSAAFAAHASRGEFIPLGEFAVAGFAAPQTVFGLADERQPRQHRGMSDADDYHPFVPDPPDGEDRRTDCARPRRGDDEEQSARAGLAGELGEDAERAVPRHHHRWRCGPPAVRAAARGRADAPRHDRGGERAAGGDVAGAEEDVGLPGRFRPVAALAEHRALPGALRAPSRGRERDRARRLPRGDARQHERDGLPARPSTR